MPRLPHQRPETGPPTELHDVRLRSAAAAVNDAARQLAAARHQLFAALAARAQRPGRQPGGCGSPAGYRAHQRAGTPIDQACADAWSWSKRHPDLRTPRAS